MEKSQDNKDTSLPKQFDKLIIEQKPQTINKNDKFKNLSLKQRQQLGIRYLQ